MSHKPEYDSDATEYYDSDATESSDDESDSDSKEKHLQDLSTEYYDSDATESSDDESDSDSKEKHLQDLSTEYYDSDAIESSDDESDSDSKEKHLQDLSTEYYDSDAIESSDDESDSDSKEKHLQDLSTEYYDSDAIESSDDESDSDSKEKHLQDLSTEYYDSDVIEDLINNTNYIKLNSKNLLEAIENKNLWFVHSTEIYHPTSKYDLANYSIYSFINLEEVLDVKNILEIPTRPAFNQSINSLVFPFTDQNIWDCRKYIFVAPMAEFIGELYMGTQQDYLTLQPHVYTKESFLLVPLNEVEQVKKDFPELKSTIVGYHYPEALKDLEGGTLEGYKCGSALENINNKKDVVETPRYAVKLLFDDIELKNPKIDIWRVKEELQWPNNNARPPLQASTKNVTNFSVRVDKYNNEYNIDHMLEKFAPLVIADNTDLEVLGNRMFNSLNKLFRNINSADQLYFLSDNFMFSRDGCRKAYGSKGGIRAIQMLKLAYALQDDASKQIDRKEQRYFKYSIEKRTYLHSIVAKVVNVVQYMEIVNHYKQMYANTRDYRLFNNLEDSGKVTDILRRLTTDNRYQIRTALKQVVSRFNATCDYGSKWREAVDEPTGKTYYWNAKTRDTRWNRPSEEEHKKLIKDFHDALDLFITKLHFITEKFNEEIISLYAT